MNRIERASKFADFAKRARKGAHLLTDKYGEANQQLIHTNGKLSNGSSDKTSSDRSTLSSTVSDVTLPNTNDFDNGNSNAIMLLKKSAEKLNLDEREPAKMAHVVTTAKNTYKASAKFKEKLNIREKLKSQMRKIAEQRLTVKQVFKRYVESSTLHGFRYTCSDTYFIRRAVWALLMVLGAIYFVVKLKEGVVEYLSYPFSTLSTIEYVDTLKFPAISFCTINQFRKSEIKSSALHPLYKDKRLPIESNWLDPGFDICGEQLVNEIRKTSFSLPDIYLGCEYINADTVHPKLPVRNCSMLNFRSYFSERGQVCFTLNSAATGNLMEVESEGLKHGYEVIFDLKNYDAVINEDYSGMQVIIHDQNETPVSQTGFFIPPGTKTIVSMEKTEVRGLISFALFLLKII